MTASRIVVEAWANLLARWGLTLAVLLSAWVALALSVFGESAAVTQVRSYAEGLAASGYSTYVIGTNEGSDATLTPDDCLGLSTVSGVRAAVWVGQDFTVRLWSPAGPPMVVRAAGGDIAAFLAQVDPAARRAWHGQPVLIDPANPVVTGTARERSVRWIGENGEATVTALAAQLTSAGAGQAGNAWLMTAAPSTVKGCVARVEEEARIGVASAVAVAFPASQGYSAQWALTNADAFETPRSRFEARPAQYFWLAGTVAVTTVWMLYLRLRRAEIAVYAVAGLSRRALWLMLTAELSTILALAGALLGSSVALLAAGDSFPGDSLSVGLRSGSRCLLAVVLCGLALAAQAAGHARSSTLDALKDR